MTDKPFAYIRWVCSECDGEPIERRTDTYDLVCETCGHTLRITRQDRAEYVPDPDDEDAEVSS
jgi:DNA-directed RNA polymerase subunit RPC12/RpoP